MYYISVLACRTEVKVFHFQIMSNSCRQSPPPPLPPSPALLYCALQGALALRESASSMR